MEFLEGILFGLGTVLFVGPVFFLLLKSTLEYGTKTGVSVALGITISDIIILLICYQFTKFVDNETFRYSAAILGAVILLLLGIKYLKQVPGTEQTINHKLKHISLYLMKGFAVNFFNPFVFAVWIGFILYGQGKYDTGVSFLTGIIVGILGIDLIKVLLAKKIGQHLSAKNLNILYKIIGVILLLFCLRLLLYLFRN